MSDHAWLGNHPERLHHLHLTYLTVLRALELAASHLSERFAFSTGMPREDARVAREVRALLASRPEWPLTFEEQRAFVGVRCASTLVASAEQMSKLGSSDDTNTGCHHGAEEELLAARTQLLGEYRSRLQNISKLMDCVGCGRCRLWGKLQVHGLATALSPSMPVLTTARAPCSTGARSRDGAPYPIRSPPSACASLAAEARRRRAVQPARPSCPLGRGGARRRAAARRVSAFEVLAARVQGVRVDLGRWRR